MTVAVEDAVFTICALAGVGVLVAMVVFDDRLSDVLDALNVDPGLAGHPWTPAVVGFLAAFGLGGLVATQMLDVGGLAAAVAAVVLGFLGALLASTFVPTLRAGDTATAPSIRDLVGRDGSVAAPIHAGRFGSVYVKAEGRTHEYSATASTDIAAGTAVTVTAALGSGLVVTPIDIPDAVQSLPESGGGEA